MNQELVFRANDASNGPYVQDITPERAGWGYSGLKVLDLQAGSFEEFHTGADEMLLLPLSGSCTVEVDGQIHEVRGRPDVFSAVTDFVYIPRDATVRVHTTGGGRFALPTSRATNRLPASYHAAEDVPALVRGGGNASREVRNYVLNGHVATDHLLVCEVITPGGNWSSYPPHKHDVDTEDERALEEIYYFEVRPGPHGPGFGFHRTYGTSERPIEVAAEVTSGDVALVPHGYHGPTMAAPDYDLYYLNVMAGPAGDGQWLVQDDPHHHWVRSGWENVPTDPRLPMATSTSVRGEAARGA